MRKINTKRLSVSIGIPVYNEENNIKHLLESILLQDQTNFYIKEIIIASDGSIDKSLEKIKSVVDNRIKCIIGEKRLGKPTRLNQIFNVSKGAIMVLLDADVIIDSPTSISYLISPFVEKDKQIGLVGGNPHPRKAESFVEKAVNATYYAYLPLRKNLRNGENPFGCDGKILALSREFAKSTQIPKNMIGIDSFLYLSCISRGFKFVHKAKASVVYRSVSNLKEHIRQNKRFKAAYFIHKNVFGPLVDKEFKVPPSLFYKLLFTQFMKTPVRSLFIFVVNLYTKHLAKHKIEAIGALWPIALSTKKGIKNE